MTGARCVDERLLRIRRGASVEICALLTGRPWRTAGWAAAGGADAADGPDGSGGSDSSGSTDGSAVSSDTASGIPHRTVVERAGLAALPESGDPALMRVAERIPAELVIADRAVALLPLTPRTAGLAALPELPEPAALVVHPGPLLASLVNLFEDIWNEALPLRVCADAARRAADGPAAGPDALDLAVLSLLMDGLTDASVAKQLGLGLRTVQRRVKRLMGLAGVTTRLQLGWHAAAHGWTTGR
ncbi:helix-turn-helix transcriptional regulator [Streptomyces roseifaciens]